MSKKSLTVGRGGQLQVLVVVCHQPLDQVDLLQGDLHCILVLGPTGGVGHPQLGVEYLLCWVEKCQAIPEHPLCPVSVWECQCGTTLRKPMGTPLDNYRVGGQLTRRIVGYLAEVGTEVDRLDLVVDKLADVPGQVIVPGNKRLKACNLVSFHPPVDQRRLPQQLANHPHPVVGVLQATGPAGDGQVDGEDDDEHQQADQQEQPVLPAELHAWIYQPLQLHASLETFAHFLSRPAL